MRLKTGFFREKQAVIPNLIRNRKVEVDKPRPCDPETGSGLQKTICHAELVSESHRHEEYFLNPVPFFHIPLDLINSSFFALESFLILHSSFIASDFVGNSFV